MQQKLHCCTSSYVVPLFKTENRGYPEIPPSDLAVFAPDTKHSRFVHRHQVQVFRLHVFKSQMALWFGFCWQNYVSDFHLLFNQERMWRQKLCLLRYEGWKMYILNTFWSLKCSNSGSTLFSRWIKAAWCLFTKVKPSERKGKIIISLQQNT